MKLPQMPVAFSEIGFLLTVMMLAIILMALAYVTDAGEENLPPVDLTRMETGEGAGVTMDDFVIVTVADDGKNGIRLFVKEKEVSFESLGPALKQVNPREVSLRVDENVRHGNVMKVVNGCRENGVRHVSFAYEKAD